MTTTRDDPTAQPGDPQSAGTGPAHRDRVTDRTSLGAHPLSGRHHRVQEFVDATSERLAGVLPGGTGLEVRSLYVDGDSTIVELLSTADAGHHRWICRFDGDNIVEVRPCPDPTTATHPDVPDRM